MSHVCECLISPTLWRLLTNWVFVWMIKRWLCSFPWLYSRLCSDWLKCQSLLPIWATDDNFNLPPVFDCRFTYLYLTLQTEHGCEFAVEIARIRWLLQVLKSAVNFKWSGSEFQPCSFHRNSWSEQRMFYRMKLYSSYLKVHSGWSTAALVAGCIYREAEEQGQSHI